jgi:Na+-translocating ferredoxin:NAD+ oxidoreductase RnfG subunit
VSGGGRYLVLVAPAVLAVPAAPAGATLYLTLEQAQRALFAGATRFEHVTVTLGDAERRAVEKASPTRTPLPLDGVWRASDGTRALGHLVVDEVYGKYQYITYAVAIGADGAVSGVEILEYRESHGGQVREASWRSQFVGKRAGDPLELGRDIVNVSGATLSCKHVTEGVRRVLALYDAALKGR